MAVLGELQSLHEGYDLAALELFGRLVSEVPVEDHTCPARQARVGEICLTVWICVLGYLDIVDESVPFLPISNVQDCIVYDLRRCIDLDASIC